MEDIMRYFSVKELVPKEVYRVRGESAIELMDKRIIDMMELLRDWCGKPMIVNDNNRNWSGYRTKECPQYTPYSQHNFGRAIDSICEIKPIEFHKQILMNLNLYKHIRFLEADINWLHIDCRDNRDNDRIKIWSPTRGFLNIDNYLSEISPQ